MPGAIQLKLQGLTYQQIADELGYTSRGTVYKIIKTAQAAQLTGAACPKNSGHGAASQ